ncbi:9967_t:CDS:2, partial [Scutellospora calospora]
SSMNNSSILVEINALTTLASNDNDTLAGSGFMYFFAYPYPNGTCPTQIYSPYHIYNSVFLQLGQIITYGGLLFTVAIYGIRSTFGWRFTFFLDDLVIIFFGFSPVIPFYAIGQICVRVNLQIFNSIFSWVIFIFWIIFSWILISVIHDFNYRYDLSANRKYNLKLITACTHLFCALVILGTNIFSVIYDYYYSQQDINNIFESTFLNFFVNIIYLGLSLYLVWHFWFYKSAKYEDVQKDKLRLFPLRVFFLTLFLSIIQVFFAYAYICSLPIIDSLFNFLVGMVLTRAVAAFFSNQRIIYDYLMEVDDETFLLFMNYANGYYTWKTSLIGYVDRERRYLTSNHGDSFKIKCRKINFIKKLNKEDDNIKKLNKEDDNINKMNNENDNINKMNNENDNIKKMNKEDDEIKKKNEEIVTLKNITLKIEGEEIKIERERIKTTEEELPRMDLKALTIEEIQGEGGTIELFRNGIIKNINSKSKDQEEKKKEKNYWKPHLHIHDENVYLIQRLKIFSSRAVNFKNIKGNVEIKNLKFDPYEPYEEKYCIEIEETKENYNEETDKKIKENSNEETNKKIRENDIMVVIEESKIKLKALNPEKGWLDGDWKLKIKDGEVYIVNKKKLKCEAKNNEGTRTIHLDRDVNLGGYWILSETDNNNKYKHQDNHYKTITIDKDSKIDIKTLRRLKLNGSTRLRIKNGKIHLEYKVKKRKGDGKEKYLKDDGKEIKIYDKPLKFALNKADNWNAKLLRKDNDEYSMFLRHEVYNQNILYMSVEGNKLINLKYDKDDNLDFKSGDIIKLSYDKFSDKTIIYEEDLSDSFESILINNEIEIKKIKEKNDTTFEISNQNNTFYEKFKSWFCHDDKLIIKTNHDFELKYIRKHALWKNCENKHFIVNKDDKTDSEIIKDDNIIKIQMYAHSIVKINKTDPRISRLENGGTLEIRIDKENRSDKKDKKDVVKVILSRYISFQNRGILKIEKGCVTYTDKPENKNYIDLTKHGFLNYIIYNHKKEVKKLRDRKREQRMQEIEEKKIQEIEEKKMQEIEEKKS